MTNTIGGNTGFIYFVRCEGYVKIGYSTKPEIRAKAFLTGNPFPCIPIGMIHGHLGMERNLHDAFRKWRHSGEWFRYTPEVEAKIASICARYRSTEFRVQSSQKKAPTDFTMDDLLPTMMPASNRPQRPPPQERARLAAQKAEQLDQPL